MVAKSRAHRQSMLCAEIRSHHICSGQCVTARRDVRSEPPTTRLATRLGDATPLLAPPAVCMHATTTSSTSDCANACSIQTSTPTSSTGDCANACSIRTSTPLLASRGRTTARMVFARALVHTTARAFLCVLQNNVNISTIAWLYDGKNNARASTCPHNCMIVFCALQNDFNTSTLDG